MLKKGGLNGYAGRRFDTPLDSGGTDRQEGRDGATVSAVTGPGQTPSEQEALYHEYGQGREETDPQQIPMTLTLLHQNFNPVKENNGLQYHNA